MINIEKFSERLEDLIRDKGMDNKTFAREVGVPESCISYFINSLRMPTITTLVKIADYFNCSADYVLGITENTNSSFKVCPPFSERLQYLIEFYKYPSPKSFRKDLNLSKSRFNEWLKGARVPSLDNIIKISEGLECSVDFVLGREN